MTAVIAEPVTGRSLVSAELFDKLASRIAVEEGFDRPFAERIMEQTLAFLKACADNPGLGLSPSRWVDIGWHAFVLHTRDYADFCAQVAGRFVHHEPTDDEDGDPGDALAPTLAAIEASGYTLDAELWPVAAKCSQCHAGCVDSPKGR